ncbi:V8-like protein Glu-specific endopeptidase-like protein [Sphaerobacter thermophilus DSM 20745]|uniref:Serine protease n=2 Tax=Sphaerobacter TaxID=2056 RepID=D1CAC4_SPHTD|nr:V8-like protein Glu-specific endopeptidase-like protein [Sphaerobacter thermophilus DSM 20745]
MMERRRRARGALALLLAMVMVLTATGAGVGASPPVAAEEAVGEVHTYDLSREEELLAWQPEPPADYQKVFPPDERTHITNTTQKPYSAVALVALFNDKGEFYAFCSGTFIAADVVLTAAHCLYDSQDGWVANVLILPGYNAGQEPFGRALASAAWVPRGWIQSGGNSRYNDYGLVKLPNDSLGKKTGWFTIGVLSTESLKDPNFQPRMAGYPGDKPFGTMWLGAKDAFTGVVRDLLYYDIDTFGGQSGSAVWRASDGVIVGVHVHATSLWNEASRITDDFLYLLRLGCRQMGCSFDAIVEKEPVDTPPDEDTPDNEAPVAGVRPVFNELTPPPFSVVAPGTVRVGARASSDSAVTSLQLTVNGQTFTAQGEQVQADVSLASGVYTVQATAVDADGDAFRAMWDIVVAADPREGQWFTANGTPKAEQINATMRSLVEAFRWHLYGQSWDGAPHPDLPSHAAFAGTANPPGPWVQGTQFDRAATEATLRSLVEAFRWHFWGISWDGGPHCDLPTHVNCQAPQGQQGVSPWFDANGAPIPSAIEATLRSLVEAFRWHFWEFSWDGGHHPDLPTHGA